MLARCDPGTAAGGTWRCSTLLAQLGLRAGEVAALALDDIDWRAGEITVHGKGRRSERLPLPTDAGEAVAAYLRGGRPEPFEGTRRVFLRVRAPHRGLTRRGSARQCSPPGSGQAGAGRVFAHRLRHSAATWMQVKGQGPGARPVSQRLGHASPVVTMTIYAHVLPGNQREAANVFVSVIEAAA